MFYTPSTDRLVSEGEIEKAPHTLLGRTCVLLGVANGLVVKAPASRAAGSIPAFGVDLLLSRHTSGLKTGTQVATLPEAGNVGSALGLAGRCQSTE